MRLLVLFPGSNPERELRYENLYLQLGLRMFQTSSKIGSVDHKQRETIFFLHLCVFSFHAPCIMVLVVE